MRLDFNPQENAFESRDLTHCTEFLSTLFVPHSLHKTSREPLITKVEHVALDKCTVVMSSYGASVDIEPADMQGVYQVKIPVTGELKIQTGAISLELGEDKGCFISPTKNMRYQLGSHSEFLTISMEREYFRDRMANIFGSEMADEMSFNPILSLDNPECRSWLGLVAYIWNQDRLIARGDPTTAALLKQTYSNLIVDQLLQLYKNDRSATGRAQHCPMPKTLRSAVTYIDANFQNNITLKDLASWSSTSGRSLQMKFQSHFGKSPKAYLREKRIEAAHKRLISATPSETVTDIAFSCGITHLGRFAGQYRDKYGCSPSEALRLGGRMQNH